MRFILSLLLLVSLLCAAPSYNEILKKIQAGDFAGANTGLETFVKSRWKAGEQERAVVLYIETSIRLGKLNEARQATVQFLDFFPKSDYRARVETAAAVLSILGKDAYSGAETLRRVLSYTKNPVAAARARDLLNQIFYAEILSTDEIKNLLEKGISDNNTRGLAQLVLGKRMQKERRYKAAAYWYNEAKRNSPNLSSRVESLKNNLDKGAGVPVILVLAPLSGPNSELGSYMSQGILLYADNLRNKVVIQVADDRADPSTSLSIVKQAIAQDSIVAIIGPLLSASAATVAAWVGEEAPQIPLITPTATDAGIAEMGKNIFQLNLSSALLVQAIAGYAMDCLKINEFAILSPLGDYGTVMSDEFQRVIERKGGMILAIQNYAEGLPDYKNEFKLLRDRKLTLDARRKNIGQGKGDVSTLFKRDSWLEDSTLTFPALFIPSSSPADAGSMAAQVAFNKLRVGYLLGSSGWNGRDLLVNAKKQAEGAVFSVAFNSAEESLNSTKEFNEKFKNKWQRDPDKNRVAGLSYDAIRIIASALNAENAPEAILQRKEYDGVYGKIKFSKNGENESIGLRSVERGNFVEKSQSCEQ